MVTKILAGRPKDTDDAREVLAASGDRLDVDDIRELLVQIQDALGQSDLVPILDRLLGG